MRSGHVPHDYECACDQGRPCRVHGRPKATVHLPALLSDTFAISRSEARRLIGTGGVRIDGATVTDMDMASGQVAGRTIQIGKRRSLRLADADAQVKGVK